LSSHDIKAIIEPYVRQALPKDWITKQTVWHVNPTGKFVNGGPDEDTELTGPTLPDVTHSAALSPAEFGQDRADYVLSRLRVNHQRGQQFRLIGRRGNFARPPGLGLDGREHGDTHL
jgi:hypothetical protein